VKSPVGVEKVRQQNVFFGWGCVIAEVFFSPFG
jgi:hypothetical protein